MKNFEAKEVIIGFCLNCQNYIKYNLENVLMSDIGNLSSSLFTCKKCKEINTVFLRTIPPPRYSLQYASTTPELERYPTPYFTLFDLHFFITGEINEFYGPGNWNGFMNLNSLDELPSIVESPVPSIQYRQDYFTNDHILIISAIVSGIIGNIAYDIVKNIALNLWNAISNNIKKNKPKSIKIDFEDYFSLVYAYAIVRLRGIEFIKSNDGILFNIVEKFKSEPFISTSQIMEIYACSKNDAKYLLKILHAEYSLSKRKWFLPKGVLDFFTGIENKEVQNHENMIILPWHTHGSSREFAGTYYIPRPKKLSEKMEFKYMNEFMDIMSPYLTKLLKDKISYNELQDIAKLEGQKLCEKWELNMERLKNKKK